MSQNKSDFLLVVRALALIMRAEALTTNLKKCARCVSLVFNKFGIGR
jgi:hypothetical protein